MGLMVEAGPEAVMPLRRMPSGDLGVGAAGAKVVDNVKVINNHPGAQISSEERQNDRGGVDLIVMIDAVEQVMANRATRPGHDAEPGARCCGKPGAGPLRGGAPGR